MRLHFVACLLLFICLTASAKPVTFRFSGKVLNFNDGWVEIANANAKGKPMWFPRSSIVGSVKAGETVVAVLSPDELRENAAAMAKLNAAKGQKPRR